MMDAFAKFHPAVNFVFFIGAIGCGVVFQHPAYLLAAILSGAVYYLLLSGRKAMKSILVLLPFTLLLAVINPLLNTEGEHILFYLFGQPYTLEALVYGGALSGVFLTTMLWLGCYNTVMTGDKFTSLFGSLIPSISLLLVMVLRMVPGLIRKSNQITGARKSIGKGSGETAGYKEKLQSGMTVLSALVSWALEGSLVTADSMRARGYGTAKRQSFMLYSITARDFSLLALQLLLLAVVIAAAILGQLNATFTPTLSIAPASWGLAAYWAYVQIPTVLHIKEAIQWHISRSKI